MALGATVMQERFENPREILGDRLREGSLYRLLADTGDRLFGDDYFADLFKRSVLGRPTVPARVLATVTLLQSFEGLSDREACDRLEVDLRWQAAAGVSTGAEAFHPTVLVGLRNWPRRGPSRLGHDPARRQRLRRGSTLGQSRGLRLVTTFKVPTPKQN